MIKVIANPFRKEKKKDNIPRTAQESIPFERMFPDGICRVGRDFYTKTIQFQDINYQLAQQEDQTEIFEEWCSFLNFFDSTVHFQISFLNMATDAEKFLVYLQGFLRTIMDAFRPSRDICFCVR